MYPTDLISEGFEMLSDKMFQEQTNVVEKCRRKRKREVSGGERGNDKLELSFPI